MFHREEIVEGFGKIVQEFFWNQMGLAGGHATVLAVFRLFHSNTPFDPCLIRGLLVYHLPHSEAWGGLSGDSIFEGTMRWPHGKANNPTTERRDDVLVM